MPIPLLRRSEGEGEQIPLLVKVLICGAIILAGTYFGFLYWFTR
jgi:hypothetical protein